MTRHFVVDEDIGIGVLRDELHAAPRAARYHAASYDAFRIPESGRQYQVAIAATALDQAVNDALAATAFNHKEHLLIRETSDSGTMLHLYAIKRKSAPEYVYRDYAYHREHRLYAAPVCAIDGSVLASAKLEQIEGEERL